MRLSGFITACIIIFIAGCSSNYYTIDDFQSVPKIDSHIHIGTDDGVFEEQAADDNFVLITLNVDHGDSANLRRQFNLASLSAQKYPGRVSFGPSFLFDTTGWGTDEWSSMIISRLEEDLSAPGVITVKIWKNNGMTLRDREGNFIMVDDPGLQPVIDFIKGKGFPITGHLGEPLNCWLPLEEMTSDLFNGKFRGLKLPKEVIDKIYRENAVSWYRLKI